MYYIIIPFITVGYLHLVEYFLFLLSFSNVKDIHDWIEVTVYDEDKDHKYEFLGKLKIPLLKVRNNERRWYSLKDKTLRKPAKGDHPQILLEMFFYEISEICNYSMTL